MANEKNISARIIHKHDIEAHWNLAENFIPKKGEIIVYDPDYNEETKTGYEYPRFKIGDGETFVYDLPFVVEKIIEKFLEASSIKSSKPVTTISLYGNKWKDTENAGIYTQNISEQLIGKITEYSKIDLQPTPEQLKQFHTKDVTFTTVNDNCVVEVYAIGVKPTNDYTDIQITITEVTTYE